jgi:hypothetical protein
MKLTFSQFKYGHEQRWKTVGQTERSTHAFEFNHPQTFSADEVHSTIDSILTDGN